MVQGGSGIRKDLDRSLARVSVGQALRLGKGECPARALRSLPWVKSKELKALDMIARL